MNTLASATLQYVLLLSCSAEENVEPRFAEKLLMPLMEELEGAEQDQKQALGREATAMLSFMEDAKPGPSPEERTILEHFMSWAGSEDGEDE